jgi:hypothetical protein
MNGRTRVCAAALGLRRVGQIEGGVGIARPAVLVMTISAAVIGAKRLYLRRHPALS